ncbi:hypothetical protein CRUP_010701 [Coryphaenoides rupestris]|nr:hypothetical protein CRUP_010701 [Coryphaenoides rupestris]
MKNRPKSRDPGTMGTMGMMVAVFIVSACAEAVTGLEFVRSPTTVISSLGKPVRMHCSLKGRGGGEEEDPPDVLWLLDGRPLEFADTNQIQVPLDHDSWMVVSTLRYVGSTLQSAHTWTSGSYGSVMEPYGDLRTSPDLQSDTFDIVLLERHRIEKVQLPDMGSYRCAVQSDGHNTTSKAANIQLEGELTSRRREDPYHMSVVANVSIQLQCVAHGPPEPVRVIWLRDGAPLNTLKESVALSPSTLNLTGVVRGFLLDVKTNKGSSCFCDDDDDDDESCAKHSGDADSDGPEDLVHNQNLHVPPSSHPIEGLDPHSLYAVRVACHSSQGPSEWGPWLDMKTKEGGSTVLLYLQNKATAQGDVYLDRNAALDTPERRRARGCLVTADDGNSLHMWKHSSPQSAPDSIIHKTLPHHTTGLPDSAPQNVSVVVNGTEVLVQWEEPAGKLNGDLQGYMVEYSTPNTEQAVVDAGLSTELSLNLTTPLSNVTFRVCAYTGAGQGPWTPLSTLTLVTSETEEQRSRGE